MKIYDLNEIIGLKGDEMQLSSRENSLLQVIRDLAEELKETNTEIANIKLSLKTFKEAVREKISLLTNKQIMD